LPGVRTPGWRPFTRHVDRRTGGVKKRQVLPRRDGGVGSRNRGGRRRVTRRRAVRLGVVGRRARGLVAVVGRCRPRRCPSNAVQYSVDGERRQSAGTCGQRTDETDRPTVLSMPMPIINNIIIITVTTIQFDNCGVSICP